MSCTGYKPLIIKGNNDSYRVSWHKYGTTYTELIVEKKKQHLFLGIKWFTWHCVWLSYGQSNIKIYDAERMLPYPLIVWYKRAVEEYEEYETAWADVDLVMNRVNASSKKKLIKLIW